VFREHAGEGRTREMDITYIPMAKGFIYLAVVLDWFSRRVLSWRVSITMEASLCVAALEEALARSSACSATCARAMPRSCATCLPNVTDAGRDLHDFTDTAALMSRLDAVIAVDTAVAHLAGALGKPLLLMLPLRRISAGCAGKIAALGTRRRGCCGRRGSAIGAARLRSSPHISTASRQVSFFSFASLPRIAAQPSVHRPATSINLSAHDTGHVIPLMLPAAIRGFDHVSSGFAPRDQAHRIDCAVFGIGSLDQRRRPGRRRGNDG
jgi:hypothetical protein